MTSSDVQESKLGALTEASMSSDALISTSRSEDFVERPECLSYPSLSIELTLFFGFGGVEFLGVLVRALEGPGVEVAPLFFLANLLCLGSQTPSQLVIPVNFVLLMAGSGVGLNLFTMLA